MQLHMYRLSKCRMGKERPSYSSSLCSCVIHEVAFVISGQLVSLGPISTWFGAIQHYVPNLAEIGILVLGISVAALLFQLMRLFINTHSSIAK